MTGTKRIIIGLVILAIGLYSFYDTLNENAEISNSEPIIESDKVIDTMFLNIIQGIVIATGTVIFGSGVRSSRNG